MQVLVNAFLLIGTDGRELGSLLARRAVQRELIVISRR